jgi:hypothetical protein
MRRRRPKDEGVWDARGEAQPEVQHQRPLLQPLCGVPHQPPLAQQPQHAIDVEPQEKGMRPWAAGSSTIEAKRMKGMNQPEELAAMGGKTVAEGSGARRGRRNRLCAAA